MKRRKRFACQWRSGIDDRSGRHAAGRSLMPRDRRRVHFSGRVQGVGFRFTCQVARPGFDVAGYVRNLPDGRVELVAEGDTQRARRVSRGRSEHEMDAYITGVTTGV